MISAQAIDATLRRICEHKFGKRGLANPLGDVFFFGERLTRGFVLDEFDPHQQPQTADVADMFVRRQRGKRGTQSFSSRRDAREEFVLFDVIEDGVARGGRNGMRLIRETV